MNARVEFETLLQGRGFDERLVGRLAHFAAILERWSKVHNLVSVDSRNELVERHLLDSLVGLGELPSTGHLVDLGAGAGLPGIPLLLALPQWTGSLVEPRSKRVAFLKTCLRELDLEATVERMRFEEVEIADLSLVTARALGRHRQVLEWARPRLRQDGEVRIWMSAPDLAELEAVAEESGYRSVLRFGAPSAHHVVGRFRRCST